MNQMNMNISYTAQCISMLHEDSTTAGYEMKVFCETAAADRPPTLSQILSHDFYRNKYHVGRSLQVLCCHLRSWLSFVTEQWGENLKRSRFARNHNLKLAFLLCASLTSSRCLTSMHFRINAQWHCMQVGFDNAPKNCRLSAGPLSMQLVFEMLTRALNQAATWDLLDAVLSWCSASWGSDATTVPWRSSTYGCSMFGSRLSFNILASSGWHSVNARCWGLHHRPECMVPPLQRWHCLHVLASKIRRRSEKTKEVALLILFQFSGDEGLGDSLPKPLVPELRLPAPVSLWVFVHVSHASALFSSRIFCDVLQCTLLRPKKRGLLPSASQKRWLQEALMWAKRSIEYLWCLIRLIHRMGKWKSDKLMKFLDRSTIR